MKHLPSSENSIVPRLEETARTLTLACSRFIDQRRGSELSDADAATLISLLGGPSGLVDFGRRLRWDLTRILEGRATDSAPYWGLIDAIGFWEDAHPGRWPYTTAPQWNRYLDWATEFSEAAVSGTIH